MNELARITRRLAEFRVEFVVANGLATLMHGGALMTRDVDVAIRTDRDNLLRLHAALDGLSPVHRTTPQRLPWTREQIEQGGVKNLYLTTDHGQLDCLGEIQGIGGYDQCFARSVAIDLDALITAKRAMSRPRDLHAVLELEAIRERLKDPREQS